MKENNRKNYIVVFGKVAPANPAYVINSGIIVDKSISLGKLKEKYKTNLILFQENDEKFNNTLIGTGA